MDPLFIVVFALAVVTVITLGVFLLLTTTFVTIALSNIDPLEYYIDYEEEPTKK